MAASGNRRLLTIIALMLMAGPLAACALDRPTWINQDKLEVVEDLYRAELATAAVDRKTIGDMANHYRRYGSGPVQVLVTYNPKNANNSAMQATDSAARIAAALAREGVKDVRTEILPVHESDFSQTHVSYISYRAQPSENCVHEGDISDDGMENFRDYSLGCSFDSYVAQQVYRPSDLLGRQGNVETDAKKQLNNVEAYRWGTSLSGDVEADDTQE